MKNILRYSALGVGALAAAANAQISPTQFDYTTLPRVQQAGIAPLIMLAVSNDHQLYFKAYTDYDDLNNDGELSQQETTYTDSETYGGYFSSNHCYTYGDGLFSIAAIANGTNNHFCSGAQWSGNFLNWATMTRMDMLRQVLYGGLTYTPAGGSTSSVILERSYLPNDAHSFAKFYDGDDLNSLTPFSDTDRGITLCNTTLHTGADQQASRNNTNPPLMRAIEGNYSLWASNERYQCLKLGGGEGLGENDQGNRNENANKGLAVHKDWVNKFTSAYEGLSLDVPATDSPKPADFDNALEQDYIVRVEACNSNFEIPNCTEFTSNGVATLRPTGILQQYPNETDALWGLITGSYESNKDGGYLRKNLEAFSNELDESGDFLIPDAGSIVNTLNAFRIAGWQAKDSDGYNHDGVAYNETSGNANSCFWGRKYDATTNGHCVDWGNPLGEILADSYRYFAGQNSAHNDVAGAAAIQEAKAPNNVKHAPWTPVTDTNYSEYACAKLNVIGLNTSAQSHDNNIQDFLAGITSKQPADNAGSTTLAEVRAATNSLLTNAGNKKYFIGSDGAPVVGSSISCDPKTLTGGNLANATGACFDSPSQNGTWLGAGLAKIASGNDTVEIQNGVNGYDINTSLEGNQRVVTHGLQLATALPQVKLKIANGAATKEVTISPACENRGNNSDIAHPNATFWGNCGLVDFNVLHIEDSEGVFYVNWEENEEGGDYDQDMHGLLSYRVISDANNSYLEVTTQVLGQSSESRLGFGYILSGVSDVLDGLHFHTGINGFPGLNTYVFDTLASYTDDQNANHMSNCAMRSGTASVYNSYNNAKTGGFNGCGIDDGATTARYAIDAGSNNESTILDPVLEFAAKASGGAFARVNKPDQLKEKLQEVVAGAMSDQPIGASEIAASGISAGGLFLHTISYPQKSEGNERVNWVGQIGALRLDSDGNLRDAMGNALEFKAGDEPTVLLTPAAGGDARQIDIEDIQYFWSTTDTIANQGARRIYTAPIPGSSDDLINTNLIKPAQGTTDLPPFSADLAGNVVSSAMLAGEQSAELIDFIRGSEPDDGTYRSRNLGDKKYLLGDIAASPVIQSSPDYSYASELNDPTYASYISAYKDARNIVYVASNDGMIHAINAGVKQGNSFNVGSELTNGSTASLGEELWAYVPFNLLPHLQWLADPNYSHVPYFDGYMRTFDVKAWGAGDAVHVGGWGTILVVGTGMGGGHFPISLDDNVQDAEIVTKPAYIVLDITDRNADRPTLMAEISHEQLGFTTVEPDVLRRDSSRVNAQGQSVVDTEWYLVFGSGPRGDTIAERRSAQTSYTQPLSATEDSALEVPYLFSYKLNEANATLNLTAVEDAGEGAFIGAINGMDWDRDYSDDAIYFGTIAGSQTDDAGAIIEPSGKLMRAAVQFTNGLTLTPSVMYDTNKPVVARPVTVINQGVNWVFAGTGRYFVREDANQTHSDNIYLGLKETFDNGVVDSTKTFAAANLFSDLGNIRVDTNGNLYGTDKAPYIDPNSKDLPTIESLRVEIKNNYDGWMRTFKPNERQHSEAGYLASSLFVGTTEPGVSQGCGSSDLGRLYVWDMRSGVPSPYLTSDTQTLSVNVNGGTKNVDEIKPEFEFQGAAQSLNGVASGFRPAADGSPIALPKLDLNIPSQRHSWREVSIPWQ